MIKFPEAPKFEPHKPEMPRVELHHDDLQQRDRLILIREDGTVIEFTEKEFDALRTVFSQLFNFDEIRSERDCLQRDLDELRSNALWSHGTKQGDL